MRELLGLVISISIKVLNCGCGFVAIPDVVGNCRQMCCGSNCGCTPFIKTLLSSIDIFFSVY